uniref:EGF domain-specific O-linked N-acetylglucosamine transferase n=1 Tax=Strigamia maritima TaxID=126957 RepID=T1JAU4_STRMM
MSPPRARPASFQDGVHCKCNPKMLQKSLPSLFFLFLSTRIHNTYSQQNQGPPDQAPRDGGFGASGGGYPPEWGTLFSAMGPLISGAQGGYRPAAPAAYGPGPGAGPDSVMYGPGDPSPFGGGGGAAGFAAPDWSPPMFENGPSGPKGGQQRGPPGRGGQSRDHGPPPQKRPHGHGDLEDSFGKFGLENSETADHLDDESGGDSHSEEEPNQKFGGKKGGNVVLLATRTYCGITFDFDKEVNIPTHHSPFFLANNPAIKELCEKNLSCPYHKYTKQNGCWGYEKNCTPRQIYSIPSCPGDHGGWAKSKQDQIDLFFSQGDFGYIRDREKEMKPLCKSTHPDDTSLYCADHSRYCRATNIMFDFDNLLNIESPMRYRMDVLKKGQLGGHCKLNVQLLEERLTHKSPLQSWAAEIQNFIEIPYRPIADGKCDIIVEKPTFLMKLDATVNMYHHFCDFFNLYLSQHMNNSFSQNVNILIWDMMPYFSNFEVMWKAFTIHPILNLQNYAEKKVCFRDLVFSFLPRMIFGMYYNMPLISGCSSSGVFHAFTHHILHRLEINHIKATNNKLRVTLLSRDTPYRKILNEDELIRAAQMTNDFDVRKVNFNHRMSFYEQLKIIHNTDILVGIHGAGLTHLLFLPDWAVIFEIYNCEDEACYRDLANLRGIHYMTWVNQDLLIQEDQGHHPTLGAHAKFTNYAFDVGEFIRLLQIAKKRIRTNSNWLKTHTSPYHEEL